LDCGGPPPLFPNSVRRKIFAATRATKFPSPSRLHRISARQAGRHIPLQTELETLFDFEFYNYAAPDGAENESQRRHNRPGFFRGFLLMTGHRAVVACSGPKPW